MFTYAQKIRLPHSFPAEICIYKHEHEKPNKANERGHEKGAGSRGCSEKNMQAQGKAAMAVSLPPSGNSELMPSDCDVLCHALRLGKCSDCAWRRLVKVYARRQREEQQRERDREREGERERKC